jgi:hypothetical protein
LSAALRLIRISAATPAISAVGWRTVVSCGQTTWALGESSKPTRVRSRGISMCRRLATAMTPSAMSSLPAKMAVGRLWASCSSRSPASQPERKLNSPRWMRPGPTARPAAAMASEKPSVRRAAATWSTGPPMKAMSRWPSDCR